ncbi:MAG: threonine synthase [Gallintestinimicrobium sp.]|uniref:threonine synthase n=1 Tax=Gallintestinimicrobium sp. TaxID=2981655 RepID=UPI000E4EA9C1|nr:threonine synthase [Firmicutes bacterium AF16-15]RHP04518.1 threonine synthase [Firmicutes bacterium AF36-19BH]
MEVLYRSTRGNEESVSASKAILEGLASDGGLFVPQALPSFDKTLDEFAQMDYRQTAYEVMKLLLTDFTEEELRYCIDKAYDGKFDTEAIAPLAEVKNAWYLELFHGPTIAFKDMALSILPYLMTTAAKKNQIKNEIVILTATSGDTGKAALAGFADVPGTRIMVFYPKDGVSPIQEKQMVTQTGANTRVIGIHGNFDDAQSGVKKLFADKELAAWMEERGYQFSSANSINIGRLVPQIVYYVYAYAQLVKEGRIKAGEEINVTVPTGNFGNILAAYYAKNMGLPIKKLICASNDNKVLYDFFRTGAYDRNRDFILTTSPSMDILISSNLERLIYRIAGENAACNASLMAALAGDGKYEITAEMKEKLGDFYGNYATQEECAAQIRSLYEDTDYVLDPHTAVAAAVYNKYKEETGDTTKTVIASTASPYKFTRTVMSAMDEKYADMDDFALTEELEKISGVKIPDAITKIRNAPVLHNIQCEKDGMKQAVMEFLEKQ